jgi:multicomponent Na+:H+ antiporter subunit C
VLVYALCFVLLAIGIYAMVAKKNVVKIIIGLAITEYAINLFFVLLGWRDQGVTPILNDDPIQKVTAADGTVQASQAFLTHAVDPLPQALVLTGIVVGLSVMALSVAIAVRLYQKYGTLDITEIRKLKG